MSAIVDIQLFDISRFFCVNVNLLKWHQLRGECEMPAERFSDHFCDTDSQSRTFRLNIAGAVSRTRRQTHQKRDDKRRKRKQCVCFARETSHGWNLAVLSHRVMPNLLSISRELFCLNLF